jgi:hypothetical protein
LVVLDLEETSNQEDERPVVQTNNFIIEIAAALLDRDLMLWQASKERMPRSMGRNDP